MDDAVRICGGALSIVPENWDVERKIILEKVELPEMLNCSRVMHSHAPISYLNGMQLIEASKITNAA